LGHTFKPFTVIVDIFTIALQPDIFNVDDDDLSGLFSFASTSSLESEFSLNHDSSEIIQAEVPIVTPNPKKTKGVERSETPQVKPANKLGQIFEALVRDVSLMVVIGIISLYVIHKSL
jgi:hypothetical protein